MKTTGKIRQSTATPPAMRETVGESEDDPPDSSPLIQECHRKETFLPIHETAHLTLISGGKRNPRTTQQTRLFKRKFFSAVPDKSWNDWHWQVSHRIRSVNQLSAMLELAEDERAALTTVGNRLPVGVTPYYLSLFAGADAAHPLRRTMIPTMNEFIQTPGEADDPLNEEGMSPLPGLIHRYPDRVLLLVCDFCSAYCRYCTRSRVVGHGAIYPTRRRLEMALEYIGSNPQVRDVLLSGGDPLTLGDSRLEWILTRLRQIPHVEIIRIGTKVPAVLPQRITPKLVRMLRRHHPIWLSLHFTHPEECTPEAYRACGMLADAGIPLGSQTVLLQGINDSVDTMKTLFHHLLKMRVRPYYIYQCDPISGSRHFRTPVAKGLQIISGLRGFTSGYAVPTYVIDAPGGGGKIPISPETVFGREGADLLLRNYEGRIFRYPDPCGIPAESIPLFN
jgi:lysine 2,3-aminomutase